MSLSSSVAYKGNEARGTENFFKHSNIKRSFILAIQENVRSKIRPYINIRPQSVHQKFDFQKMRLIGLSFAMSLCPLKVEVES